MEVKDSWKIKLSILDKRINAFKEGYRQNIAILGSDSEEISYLLDNYLIHNKYNEFFYIRILTSYNNPKDFFKNIALSFFTEYTNRIDTLDCFLSSMEIELSSTVTFIKSVLRKNNISFLDIIELMEKFINETQKKYIFFIEEFTELNILFPSYYHDFTKFIILQRNCMIVLTSSNIPVAEHILSTELNLLFGNFEKIYTDEVNFINNYLYLKSIFSPLSPSSFFISFFINILGNNLMYYDLISNIVKNEYNKDDEVNSLSFILENSLYRKDTYFYQKFMKKIESIKEIFNDYYSIIRLLLALAEGYLRRGDLASIGIYDSTNLKIKLDKLNKLNYIVNFGNIYKIADSLFSFWLLNTFKVSLLSLDLQKKYILWKWQIEKEIEIFKEKFFKDNIKKITELLSSFKNDTLYINKNEYILPKIEKVKIISYPNSNLIFLIPQEKENISLAFKEKIVEDNDIFEFLQLANIRTKKVKRIFITTSNFTSSAKLLAKNHKLLIWDNNNINLLLSIYNLGIICDECFSKDENENTSNF